MKTTFAIAACMVLFAAPVMAATECTDADMTKLNGKIEKMAAGDNKTKAMEAMKMAKDSMGKSDTAGCVKHMSEAKAARKAEKEALKAAEKK